MVEGRSEKGGENSGVGVGSRVSFMFSGAFGSGRGSTATTAKTGGGGVAAFGFWGASNGVAIFITAMAGVALAVALIYSHRGNLKSPWSRRRRKLALWAQQWCNLFLSDGRLIDGGVKLLKKVRSGGVDPGIRKEVWPFLLGVYELNSTQENREATRIKRRKQYDHLRRRCKHLEKSGDDNQTPKQQSCRNRGDEGSVLHENPESPCSEDLVTATESVECVVDGSAIPCANSQLDDSDKSQITSYVTEDVSNSTRSPTAHGESLDTESSNSESSAEDEEEFPTMERISGNETINSLIDPVEERKGPQGRVLEDYATWQRIIRLDAIRANGEWIPYSPAQTNVSEEKAVKLAESVGLKDYDCLEPCRIYHAARLVAILEAYTVYDPEIGYCQGMSDLLSPIISVIEEDYEAFWCFVGFMKNARHNFRLDEVGIRRQLNIVSKIIKSKDSHLYKHLQKLQAEDCFFVYRMVVVLFRRELNFEQTLCLWEVMWADQAAIRAGIGKSAWGRIRPRAPPTNDLLLYAIAACVLQRRKLIIESYSSMDEIIRECNNMAGQLDVWKLLDDAHDLVVTLHDKI